jgi:hypothetical protein
MSDSPITSNPRFLLFPQVDRADVQGRRPKVRRYSLTLLSGAAASAAPPKVVRPPARGLTA